MAVTVDDQIEGLVDKLNDVSHAWGDTFPADPSGYRRLQRLIRDHGRGNVVACLQYALDAKISPQGSSAMPLLVTLCKNREGAG